MAKTFPKQMNIEDRLSVPSPYLRYLTIGTSQKGIYLNGGKISTYQIISNLKTNSIDFADFSNILDFGCGCGRIIQHLQQKSNGAFYGVDYNPKIINWCRSHLNGNFSLNSSMPPLQYQDGTFDFVYSWSVFTHFTEEQHRLWLLELYRVLREGGYLWFSYAGENSSYQLSPSEQQRFHQNQIVTHGNSHNGSNWCCSYYSKEFLRKLLSETSFHIVDLIQNKGAGEQSFCLLQKRGV